MANPFTIGTMCPLSVVSDSLAAAVLTSGPESSGISAAALLAGVYRGGPAVPLLTNLPECQQRAHVQQAWAQLVSVMRTLCSPDGGWPPERPQTPENLRPYVGEEAEELLEALNQCPSAEDFPSPSPPSPLVPERCQSLGDLLPWLLWGVASSRDGAMGWLEGRPAHLTGTEGYGQGQRISGLRLVPCLHWHSADGTQNLVLDVATQTLGPERSPLADATTVSFLPGLSTVSSVEQAVASSSPPPLATPVGALITQLWGAIDRHHPPLAHLRQGWSVDLLLPGHDWVAGQLSLALVWVEIPLADTGGASPPETTDEPSLAALDQGTATVAAPPSLTSALQWTSPQVAELWLDQAVAQQMPLPWAIDSPPEPLEALSALISATHQRAILSPLEIPISQAGVGGQLVALWPWLRWWVLQTDPVVMALMAGVSCDCLPPGGTWQSGSLGLQLWLRFQDAAACWALNLLTGEWETDQISSSVGLNSVVTLPHPILDLPALTGLSAVQGRVQGHLQGMCPVIAALMAGTSVQLHPQTGGDRRDVEAVLDLAVVFQPHRPSRSPHRVS